MEHALSTLAAAQVELVKLVGDLATKTATQCTSPHAEGSSLKRRSTSEATTIIYRAHDQPSLFDVGVRIVPNPKRPKLQTVRPLSGLLKCPHCAFQCRKPGPMMMHKKNKHKAAVEAEASRGTQSVASLMLNKMSPEAREAHSGRLPQRDRDVKIAFIMKEIVNGALAKIKDMARPSWLATEVDRLRRLGDGRRRNKGSSHRQARSISFKAKIIMEYERLFKQVGLDHRGSVATIIGDIFDVCAEQVRRYVRNKAVLLERFHTHRLRDRSRIRDSQNKGRFANAEKASQTLLVPL